jgi:hypothetical protein
MSASKLPRTPFVLLGLMTLFTVGGPIAIALTLRGGQSRRWPPDRLVEWLTFGVATGGVALLMIACLAIGLASWRKNVAAQKPRSPAESQLDKNQSPSVSASPPA